MTVPTGIGQEVRRIAESIADARPEEARTLLNAADQLDQMPRLRGALDDALDAAERARAGSPIASEEWYARRDYARVVLKATAP